MSTKLNLKAHFDAAKRQHQEQVDSAMAKKAELLKQAKVTEQQIVKLENDLKAKKTLVEQNKAEGIDTTKLETKIRDLETQLGEWKAKLTELLPSQASATEVEPRNFEREISLQASGQERNRGS